MVKERYECIVCGRKFPKGQGVVIDIGGKLYTFHSKSCALKFLRRAIEEIEPSLVIKAFDKVNNEFKKEREEKQALRSKSI